MVPVGTARDSLPKGAFVALVDGRRVPLVPVSLPQGLRGVAREQVARRQFRDVTGQGEGQALLRPYFTPGGQASWSRILVSDRALDAELQRGAGAQKGCIAVLPDYLGLPAADDLWVLKQDGGCLVARLGPQDGFTAELPVARRMLASAQERAAPKAALWLGPPEAMIADWLSAAQIPVLASPEAAKKLGLAMPAVLAHGEAAFDLRRDPQAARQALRRQVLPWRWPLALGAMALTVWAAAAAFETRRFAGDAKRLQNETMALVRQAMIPSGPVLDVRSQVARALEDRRALTAGGGAPVSPLALMRQSADVLVASGATVQELRYSAGEGLGVEVDVADFAALDALVAGLAADGVTVRLISSGASDAGGGVRAAMFLAPDGGR